MDITPARFKRRQRYRFHNSIIGNFVVIKTDQKQIYCTVVIRAGSNACKQVCVSSIEMRK